MASLCGRLGLVTPRDAFITAICKASLPLHYALTVLSSSGANLSNKGVEYFKLNAPFFMFINYLMSSSAPRM